MEESARMKNITNAKPGAEIPESRRNFLRDLIGKTGQVALGEAERRLARADRGIVRPPGALSEVEFLPACTRCGDCVTACPEGALFMLGAHTGLAVNTPALDLVNNACALCADFPCIAACEPAALLPVEPLALRFAEARIDPSACLPFQGPECGVCVMVCPVPGALVLEGARPRIDPEHCTGCALCRRACIVSPKAVTVHPRA